MSGPLIFVSHSKIKPGKAGQYHAHCVEATEVVEAEEPQIIAFNHYRSGDGTEVSTVQVHPDADSLDTHLKLYQERLMDRGSDALETHAMDVYGTPSDSARQFLEHMAKHAPSLRLRLLPMHEAGFQRPQPM